MRIYDVSTILQTESSKLLENPEKTILGPMLGQHWLQNNSGRRMFSPKPSPRQTSIDKTNDCVMNSEQSALVRGPDPP